MRRLLRNFLITMSFWICLPSLGWAQEADEIKIIPYSQIDPDIPHPAYSGAPVTLKGIIRNASCASYTVRWDTDRDGNFGDETARNVSRNDSARAVFDIGRNFTIPTVQTDQRMNVNVEVRCGNNEPKYATMKFFIYAFTPNNNPDNWSDEQLQIMTQVAIQESLWYIHRTMAGISGRGRTLEAQDSYEAATGLALWTFTINGHLPAYPPEEVNFPVRDGFLDDNSLRWHNDPYAETAMRYANYMAARGRQRGIPGGEEDNSCGYNVDGSARFCNRIDANNNKGAYAGHSNSGWNVYRMGVNLGGLATILPALAGTEIQVGRAGGDGNDGIRDRNWEWYIQQMVDQLGAQQIDGGCGRGGWLYGDYNGDGPCSHSDASTSQWAYIGLESAEIAGGPYGVIVNNRHKYRIADNLINNQRGDGAAGYRSSSGTGDFKLTGGSVVGARWLGLHQFASNDGSTAFRGQSTYSKGRLRTSYDTYIRHLNQNWNNQRSWGSHWQDSMWKYGDYKCGNNTGVYNRGRCGSTYAMYSLQKGFRTGQPELLEVGNHDWVREFNTYYVRAQDRYASNATDNYNIHGRVKDDYCEGHSVTCSYAGGRLAAPMGTLTMTPSIFNPKPVPIASVNPPETREGCAGGNNGRVTFDHGGSFHPNPESRIILYRWDVDSGNGLWWDSDADPDFATQPDLNGNYDETFEFTYQRPGNYTATLQVVDEGLQVATTTVSVRVLQADNVAPSVAPGGPYVIEVGQALQLDGSATDGNLDCGDSVTTRWEFSGNNQFDDAEGERPTVPWGNLNGLPVGQPVRIFVRASDESNAQSAVGETTLTIYPTDPIAEGSANPSPAGCQQEVTFNGRNSAHPNPQRSIARYEWNLDGAPGFDRENPEVTWTYDQFGTYPIVLRVTDDLGRSDVFNFNVDVNQGNRPPVARIASAEYVVLQGDSVTLDGRTSSDNDAACGDQIANYRWTYQGPNGQVVELANGPNAANPTLAWNVVQSTFQGPTNRNTGEPSNTVTLTVTDGFGATASATTRVKWFAATPIARVSQTPDPGMIGQNTGRAQVSFDGRGSSSPVPGMTIATYQWIFDQDAQPDANANPAAEGPTVNYVKFFDPVPGPDTIPVVSVWLRVVDEDGRASEWTRYNPNYDVPPTRPTADADPTDPPEEGYHILECEALTLDGSQSDDPDDEDYVRHYRWDLDYNADNQNEQFEADIAREDDNNDGEEATTVVSVEQLTDLGVFDAAPNGACAGLAEGEESRQYNIRLEVEDNFQQLNTDDAPLTIYRTNPVAAAAANPNPAACNVQITLDGSECYHPHPDIRIVSWEWDINGNGVFGEDVDAQGMMTQTRFTEFTFGNERKRVNLRVTDSRDNQSILPLDIQVDIGNRAPTPVAGGGQNADGEVVGPYTIAVVPNGGGGYAVSQVSRPAGDGTIADSITLSAQGTRDPDEGCGDSVQSLVWQINAQNGQGYIDVPNGNQETVTLSWPDLVALGVNQPGNYDVRVTATDRFGEIASATQRLQVVEGPTAIGEANPARTGCENNVTFSAAASQANGPADQGFNIVTYEWDLDGEPGYESAGREVTRAAVGLPDANNGGAISMTVGLKVTDASGRVGTTTVDVNIDSQSVPPVADAGGPYDTGRIGGGNFASVTLDGRGSTDPNQPCDSIVYYAWDMDLDGNYGPADGEPGGWAQDGAAVVDYVDNTWLIGTERTVRLIVCDANYQGGNVVGNPACSDPDETDIRIGAEAPPSGEVLSPRAEGGSCFGAGNMTVRYRVSDPAGDRVLVTGYVGDVEVYSQRVDAPADGQEYEFTVDTDNLVPEGRHEIDLVLDDERGGATLVNSGGRLLFDRTAPVVSIGNRLAQDFCYNPNQVPNPDVTVDDVDNAPSIARETVEDGCGRTLVVRATDACGNVGEASRSYLVAQAVDLELTGAANGELVPQTQYTWEVVGRAECADDITATLARNGGAAADYAEGQVINQPGDYVLSVSVENCQGVARDISRNFAINRPPVAVPVPDGHPNRVPNELAYIIDEGGTLQLDCSASRAPENSDRITRCQWDTDGDGNWDLDWQAAGPDDQPAPLNYNANEDGQFQMRLRVSDGATPPATGEETFTVTVNDVDPVADPGGPYVVAQGVALTLDGRASAPGSPADPISSYSWEFNDGSGACAANDQQRQNCSPVEGADVSQPVHIFAEHGTYNVELTVTDEDSSTTQTVRVEVRDVDPVIEGLDEPEQAHEISYMTYTLNATPGAPGDPILRYEWDINPAGAADAPEPEYAGRESSTIRHQFHDAGEYNMRVTIRDGDSASRVDRRVVVAEVTLKQLLEHIKVRVDEVVASALADGDLDPVLPLAEVDGYLTRSIWGEAYDYRGNTLIAMEGVLQRTAEAQANGVRFGLSHWAMSRQLVREMTRHRASIVEGGVDAADPSIVRADEYIADMRAIYDAAGFKNSSFGQNGGQLTQQILAKAIEAYYWLEDSVDQCNTNDRFDISGIPQAQLFENMQRLENTNTAMIGAFGRMRDEWTNYRNAAGSADDPGPGADQASTCMATLTDDIMPNASKPVTFPCQGDQICVTDREALDMEMNAMSLIDQITELEAQGVWVRNWKTCLTMGLRFRIELSLLRVEFLCGANTPFVRQARQVQQVGLDMVDEGRFGAALQYYATNDRRCLMMDVYNQCIVPQTRVPSDPSDPTSELVRPEAIELPAYCAPPEDDDAQADDAQGGGG